MSQNRLPQRIARVMRELGVNQQEFARLVGISQPAISLYLKGRIPPADVLYRMARVGGVSMEWLLGAESSESRMVRESPPAYGKQAVLLELWERLPAEIQQDLLSLLRHLTERRGNE
jgi:transcriptional regulator with XRE-family HTH domain